MSIDQAEKNNVSDNSDCRAIWEKGHKKMKYKNLILSLLLITTLLMAQDNDPSLVAHYKLSKEYFNNQVPGKFFDLSGNGNHATPYGEVNFTEDQLGNPTGAMIFDTSGVDNYLNCGSSDDFELNNDRTIMIWLNAKVVDNKHNENIFSKGSPPYNQYNFTFNRPKGLFAIQSRSASKDIKIFQSDYDILLFREKYHLFTLTYDSSVDSMYVYKNCIFQYVFDVSEFDFNKPGNFLIGNALYAYNSGHPNNTFQGKISEFLFYNRKLSLIEIENHYNNIQPHYVDWDFETKLTGDFSALNLSEAFEGYGQNEVVNEIKAHSGEYCLKHTCSPGNNRSEIWREERYEGYKEHTDGDPTTIPNPMVKSNHSNGETRWYKWYFLIPEDFRFGELNSILVMQMFERSQNVGISPTYLLDVYNKNGNPVFRFYSVLWEKDSDGNIAQQAYCYDIEQDISITYGKWNELVLHVYMSTNSDGYLEGWINGTPILKKNAKYIYSKRKQRTVDNMTIRYDGNEKYTYNIINHKIYGQNLALDDWNGSEFRVGQYRGEDPTTNSVYTDDIKIGKTAQSIGFDPNNPIPQKTNLDIANTNITFDETPKGQSKTDYLIIKNIGDKAVNILNIIIADTTNYKINSFPDSDLSPGDSTAVEVLFSPQNKNKENSIMVIYTNDVVQDSIAVQLQGKGVYPPELKINIPQRRR